MAACGGDDDDDGGAAETTAAAAPAESDAAPTTAAAVPDTTAAEATDSTAAAESETTAATAADDAELVAAATEEGKVTVYSSQGLDALNQLATNFEAKYPGIDVEIVRGIDSDLAPKVEAENQTGQGVADLYVNASLSWVQPHAEQGWFLPVDGPELTGQGSYDAEQYVHEGNYFEVGSAVLTFGWNTDLYPPASRTTRTCSIRSCRRQARRDRADRAVDRRLLPLAGGDLRRGVRRRSSPRWSHASTRARCRSARPWAPVRSRPRRTSAPRTLEPLKAQGAPVEFGISPRVPGAPGSSAWSPPRRRIRRPGSCSPTTWSPPEARRSSRPPAGSVLPDVPGTLITNDEVREQDLSKLTPEVVAAYQEKWNGLFR